MKVKKLTSKEFIVFEVNSPDPVIEFNAPLISRKNAASKKLTLQNKDTKFFDKTEGIEISETPEGITVKKFLRLDEHISGLGEKAFEIERRRIFVRMWDNDSYSYGWYTDPLYVSIPFFISVYRGVARGFFVNSCSNVTFDIGVASYDKIIINIPERSVRFYLIEGPSVERVLENYSTLTGKPFMIPEWALGHQISRYSYYPQDSVVEIVKQYMNQGFRVSCVYLDIDYTKDMKILTWNKERFPNPKSMIKELHSLGTRVVVNIGPGIKIDQDYEIFRKGMGLYCKTPNNEAYIAPLWAGNCVFPDFLNDNARKFWTTQIKKFVSSSGLDGVWLDMNEPSVFTKSKTFDEQVVHQRDSGERVEHKLVHNAYSYFESEATFEALKEDQEPYILTRAGCAGIQKYAAVWSGDNVASWENMRLQIPLLLSLSVSGIPYVGCDIGGFIGRSDPELVTRFYEMALFFPIFRNHKGKDGNDQEAFRLPVEYRDRVRKVIELRYSFLPYLVSLAREAHEFGHPIIRPLSYEFQKDDDTYAINDEYMIGKSLLYAPIVEKGRKDRDVYLPEGKWQSWQGEKGETLEGGKWISTQEEIPLYVRFGSIVPTKERIVVWGPSASFLFYERNTSTELKSSGPGLTASKLLTGEREIEFKESQCNRVSIDKSVSDTDVRNNSTFVKTTKFKEIKLLSD